jgi:hypothetical protein
MREQRSASVEEAAAIAAAVERFVADTAAPAASGPEEPVGPWQRAALVEGVSAKRTIKELEGGMG